MTSPPDRCPDERDGDTLEVAVAGRPGVVRLAGERLLVGRGSECDLRLDDPSVSRRHAEILRHGGGWRIRDLGSAHGVAVNGVTVRQAPLEPGDRVVLGGVELEVRGARGGAAAAPAPPNPAPQGVDLPLDAAGSLPLRATVIRRLGEPPAPGEDGGAEFYGKRRLLEQAYGNEIFGHLLDLAGHLIRSAGETEVLERTLAVAFEALPAERGFLFLQREDGELVCELARFGARLERRPARVPVSQTLLRKVVEERLALVTEDALEDERLEGGQSLLLHRIRSAACAPLAAGPRVLGVLQVDCRQRAGAFTEQDLDLLAALANFAAVAVERIRWARRAEAEEESRRRLARYHAPAVVEEILRRDEPGEVGRRHLRDAEVTVLFADLVGFTPFVETAPPEAVVARLDGFFELAVEAVFAAGGTLDKFLGDGVMAFFGAPVAQPDHAVRAVGAALVIQRRVRELAQTAGVSGGAPPAVRIGLASGAVKVGEIGSGRRVDYTVLGAPVNLAARLERQAGAGEIVLGPETWRLVGGTVPTEPLGQLRLKGLAHPVEAWRVVPPQPPTGGV
jgi:adenylate cyclase